VHSVAGIVFFNIKIFSLRSNMILILLILASIYNILVPRNSILI